MKTLKQLLQQPGPLVMGILNTTPDSFSDGGQYFTNKDATQRIEAMLSAGADIIDIGGESTRPGASEVSVAEELERVIPLVEVAKKSNAIVSVDTSKPEVMAAAIASGANMINDVRALQEDGALEVVAASTAYVCVMHMQGQPRTMQNNPHYDDVVAEVQQMLSQRITQCESGGVERERIVVDPGFGFGKSLAHNTELMNNLSCFQSLACPILVGVSRKTMIGQIVDKEVSERMIGSVVAASYAAMNGAKILRVHDVEETVQAMKILKAFTNNKINN
ncbi:dihydropteroate synthase [Kangiella marina]|uniref:Dihydropteroate synthase n=1 Tax=Kangiella marina TaxID=1079178 RepID=A0ABP8IHV2_9GAMM